MPLFAIKGNKYVGAIQCGAGRDAYLEFELSKDEQEKIEIYPLEPLEHDLSKGVDPQEILKAAVIGANRAFEKTKQRYFIKSIGYIPNDLKHYDIHSRIVYSVIEHLHNGGEFKTIDEKV